MRTMLVVLLVATSPALAHTLPALENGSFDRDVWPWATDDPIVIEARMTDDASGSVSSRAVDLRLKGDAMTRSGRLWECLAVDPSRTYDAGTLANIPTTDQNQWTVGAELVLTWYAATSLSPFRDQCTGTPLAAPLSDSVSVASQWEQLTIRGVKPPAGATHVLFSLVSRRTYELGLTTHVLFDDAFFVAAGGRAIVPAVASLRGAMQSEWSSDLYLVNRSFNDVKTTLLYRCMAGGNCNMRPREVAVPAGRSVLLTDVAATLFESPNSGGGVEVIYSGQEGDLIVTSRLNSRAPRGTFGAEVPAVPSTALAITTLLVGLRNEADYRTNLGFYNPGDARVEVHVSLLIDGAQVGPIRTITIPAHALIQVNAFENAAVTTDNGVVRVGTRFGPVIAFASVINNSTNDVAYTRGFVER